LFLKTHQNNQHNNNNNNNNDLITEALQMLSCQGATAFFFAIPHANAPFLTSKFRFGCQNESIREGIEH